MPSWKMATSESSCPCLGIVYIGIIMSMFGRWIHRNHHALYLEANYNVIVVYLLGMSLLRNHRVPIWKLATSESSCGIWNFTITESFSPYLEFCYNRLIVFLFGTTSYKEIIPFLMFAKTKPSSPKSFLYGNHCKSKCPT